MAQQNQIEFQPLPAWQRSVLLFLLLAVVCGFNVFVQPLSWSSPQADEFLRSFLSIQMLTWMVVPMGSLLAFWTALGPAPLGKRVSIGLALFILLVVTAGGPGPTCELLAFLFGIQFAVGATALLVLRRFSGWQLAASAADLKAGVATSFSLRALLFWFLEGAALVSLVGWLSHLGPAGYPKPLSLETLAEILKQGLAYALVAAPTIFIMGAILAYGRAQTVWAVLAISGLAAVAILSDFGSGPLGPCLPGIPRFWANASTLFGLATCSIASGSFLAACGYRLVRRAQLRQPEADTGQVLSPPAGGPRFAAPLWTMLLLLVAIVIRAVMVFPGLVSHLEELRWERHGLRAGTHYGLGEVDEVEVLDPIFNQAIESNDQEVFELLEGAGELHTLNLENNQNADAQIRFLSKYPRVKMLKLNNSSVTDAGLDAVAKMTGIENLDLAFTSVTDAGIAKLKSLPNLHAINLVGTKVTDAGAAELETFSNLESITLGQATVTPPAIKRLQQALPKAHISNY